MYFNHKGFKSTKFYFIHLIYRIVKYLPKYDYTCTLDNQA